MGKSLFEDKGDLCIERNDQYRIDLTEVVRSGVELGIVCWGADGVGMNGGMGGGGVGTRRVLVAHVPPWAQAHEERLGSAYWAR